MLEKETMFAILEKYLRMAKIYACGQAQPSKLIQ